MKYLLDSNVVIALLRRRDTVVRKRLSKVEPEDVLISTIVLHELYYGAFKSGRVSHHLSLVEAMSFQTIDFDREDARQAGMIRGALALSGTVIGPYNSLIAAQAVARKLTLVTSNVKEFARVPKLRIEDWSS